MPKLKPKQARVSKTSSPKLYFGAALLALVAVAVAGAIASASKQMGASSPAPSSFSASFVWATAADRLGAKSPSDAAVADACENIKPLWNAGGGDRAVSCESFLSEYWERKPLLSRPGAAWTQRVMRLGDIPKMVGAWPVRFFKNHATASLHKPNSGFLADDRWQRGQDVPTDIVDVAMEEQRTLVMHNLEVYWPTVGALIRGVVRFFHAYTQVNVYISPANLSVATAPHQDAHSVFIVQVHGRKRWCVHAPPAPWILKAFQRGKNGDVLPPTDRSAMGPVLLNVTLHPVRARGAQTRWLTATCAACAVCAVCAASDALPFSRCLLPHGALPLSSGRCALHPARLLPPHRDRARDARRRRLQWAAARRRDT